VFSFLKNHPFAVKAHFDSSIVLTFAVPKVELQDLLPECLELDTYDDKWAFLAVAMVQTRALRPNGLPKFFGHDFFLIGYRIFVRYRNNEGKRMRGLYILKSETDSKRMELLGNLFTHYAYTTTDISMCAVGETTTIISKKSDLNIRLATENESTSLPPVSPFHDWKEARRFAGPLPFTFTYNSETKTVLIIEGVRQDWIPKPIDVIDHHIGFLVSLNLKEIVLANAFIVRDVPYHWKKGRVETWNA
jgi:uncharacterized protein YqjF (DUF2071 family)